MNSKEFLDFIGLPLAILFIFAIVFEVLLLGFAFFGADEIECNFLWCTFTTTNKEVYEEMSFHQDCWHNGKRINCSDIPTYESFVKLQESGR